MFSKKWWLHLNQSTPGESLPRFEILEVKQSSLLSWLMHLILNLTVLNWDKLIFARVLFKGPLSHCTTEYIAQVSRAKVASALQSSLSGKPKNREVKNAASSLEPCKLKRTQTWDWWLRNLPRKAENHSILVSRFSTTSGSNFQSPCFRCVIKHSKFHRR